MPRENATPAHCFRSSASVILSEFIKKSSPGKIKYIKIEKTQQMQLHPHLLMNFYCLQYAQFIRLLERLSALPCDAAEEEFVGRFRRTVTVQSKKHLIEPLQYDEQGMAFSTGRGNAPWRRGAPPSVGRRWDDGGGCALSPFAVHFVLLSIFAVVTLDFRGFKILVDILKTQTFLMSQEKMWTHKPTQSH